jgi:stage V sporulation protein B
MFKPLLAALLMGAAAWGVRFGLERLGMRNLIVVAGAIAAAGVAYLVLVLVLRIITMEDCKLLPKGDKIAKILRIH